MIKAKSMTDQQLFELIRGADPLTQSRPACAETETDRLVRRILSYERNSTPPKRSLRLAGAQLRGKPFCAALGVTGGAVGAAVAAVLVVTAGSSPSVAFAGWSAYPTAPANGQAQAAESTCATDNAAPASPASLTPTVIDTRGPYTALLYAESNTITACIASQPGTGTATTPAVVGGVSSEPGTAGASNASPLAAGTIGWQQAGLAENAPPPISLVDGQVAAGVTAVTLELQDGSSVQATIANGWFIAWWPSNQPIQAAKITTASGTTTQPAPPIALGLARVKARREALTQAQGAPGPDGTIIKSVPSGRTEAPTPTGSTEATSTR